MEKRHIVDAEEGKLCLTCKRIGSHEGRNYCGRFVTAHDGEFADLALVRYLRGDSCHTAWEPKTAPIVATPHGWLDLGTGKIVEVPDRPVEGEQLGSAEGLAMGLSAGGIVRDAPAYEEPAPLPEGVGFPPEFEGSHDRFLNPACWPEGGGGGDGWGRDKDGSIILLIGPDGNMTAHLKGGDAGEEKK